MAKMDRESELRGREAKGAPESASRAPADAIHHVLALQRAAGNAAVGALIERGQPLPTPLRMEAEERFGHNFGAVRIHTGARAIESASTIGAKAFTLGTNVVFGAGQFLPQTPAGKRLIGHELAHVVQQSRGGAPPPLSRRGSLENAANRAGDAFASGHGRVQVTGASAPGVAADLLDRFVGRDVTSLSDAQLQLEAQNVQDWLDTSGTPDLYYAPRRRYLDDTLLPELDRRKLPRPVTGTRAEKRAHEDGLRKEYRVEAIMKRYAEEARRKAEAARAAQAAAARKAAVRAAEAAKTEAQIPAELKLLVEGYRLLQGGHAEDPVSIAKVCLQVLNDLPPEIAQATPQVQQTLPHLKKYFEHVVNPWIPVRMPEQPEPQPWERGPVARPMTSNQVESLKMPVFKEEDWILHKKGWDIEALKFRDSLKAYQPSAAGGFTALGTIVLGGSDDQARRNSLIVGAFANLLEAAAPFFAKVPPKQPKDPKGAPGGAKPAAPAHDDRKPDAAAPAEKGPADAAAPSKGTSKAGSKLLAALPTGLLALIPPDALPEGTLTALAFSALAAVILGKGKKGAGPVAGTAESAAKPSAAGSMTKSPADASKAGKADASSAYPWGPQELRAQELWMESSPLKHQTNYTIVGPQTAKYNCFAYSVGITDAPKTPIIDRYSNNPLSLVDAFYAGHGFKRTQTVNPKIPTLTEGELPRPFDYTHTGTTKVVVYGEVANGKIVRITHAAVQSGAQRWRSKLGDGPLIQHPFPSAVAVYGIPIAIYEKK
jgi:hypothetical protein